MGGRHYLYLADSIAVIAFVGQQRLGLGDGDRHEGIDSTVVRRLTAGQDEADRASLIVTAGVDLARKAAA